MSDTRLSLATTLAAILWSSSVIGITASAELDRAKELYRTASYDEALSVLDALAGGEGEDSTEIYEYRVFCLVALDRREEAEQAMAALVTANPTYTMSEAVAAPRVRSMFSEVRRSLLPAIIQRSYKDAKALFDRKDPKALAQLERVLSMLKDPDVAEDDGLADLATVAGGFRDLSKAMAAPAPPPQAAVPTAAIAPAAIVPTPPVLVAPVVVSQPVPIPQLREEREWDGEIEVTIDERGRVVAARMLRTIHPIYDQQLMRAAMAWTYRPALRDGSPIQFLKQITIHVDTRPVCGDRVSDGCRPAATDR
jgi:hypothetical protein